MRVILLTDSLGDPPVNQQNGSQTPKNNETKQSPKTGSPITNGTINLEKTNDAIKPAKRIGILTSGGDSSGMNAAVRAMTRVAIAKGCIPFAIYEGYQGLVDGGEKIKELKWHDVKGFLAKGGTQIGTYYILTKEHVVKLSGLVKDD